ncbi:MAG: LPS export ABC transporter permease LptG [Hyphomicrobiaceae bacterium]|nr:LPS export ABC transporter permease LptG [Hyphomicrobiaceae bacterium]
MTAGWTFARYVSWRFLIAILVVTMVCVLLLFLADMIEMLRRAGKNNGTSVGAGALMIISLLRLPARTELIIPFTVLIGSIGALLMLSRKSELVVARAAGMSVWQFIMPGIVVAVAIGLFMIMVYSPLSSYARGESERLYANAFGKESSFLDTKSAGAWLRQDGVDGQSVMHANIVSNRGLSLRGVSIWHFDKDKNFAERIEAKSADLHKGYWVLKNATVSAAGREPAFYENYLVSTHLTPTHVNDSLGTVSSVSFWELPKFIDLADKAGLPATRHKMRYQILLSLPLLLVVMVLLAATCSLQSFRFGKVQTMAIIGLASGFVFFMFREVSHNIGKSGLAAPEVAAWAPAVIGTLLAATVLLHREDG